MRGVAFRHAEWLLDRQIDGAFDLTKENYQALKGATKETGGRIRKTVLPPVATTLMEASHRFEKGLTSADLIWLEQRVLGHRRELMAILAEPTGTMALRLTKAEIDHFEASLKEENADVEALVALSPEDLKEKQDQRLVKALKFWVGSRSTERLKQLSFPFASAPEAVTQRLELRRLSQGYFMIWLRGNSGREIGAVTTDIRRWVTEPYWFVPNAAELGMNSWMPRFLPKLKAFEMLLSKEERASLVEALRAIADDVQEAAMM